MTQRLGGPLRILGDQAAGARGLDPHHRHMVRHDVVQFAGDPQALVHDGLFAQAGGLSGDEFRLLRQPGLAACLPPGHLAHGEGTQQEEGIDEGGEQDIGGDRWQDPATGHAIGLAGTGDALSDGEVPAQPHREAQRQRQNQYGHHPSVGCPRHAGVEQEEDDHLVCHRVAHLGHPRGGREEVREDERRDRQRPAPPQHDQHRHGAQRQVLDPVGPRALEIGERTHQFQRRCQAQRHQDPGDDVRARQRGARAHPPIVPAKPLQPAHGSKHYGQVWAATSVWRGNPRGGRRFVDC